jgi:hypothetical protein
MLRVTIELVPQGDENRRLHLGTAEIINDGTGDSEKGNYKIRLSKWGNPAQIWKCGELRGFPRKDLGPWDLLSLCLVAAIGDRIKEFVAR